MRSIPFKIHAILFGLLFLGFVLNLLAFADLNWTHWVLVQRTSAAGDTGGGNGESGPALSSETPSVVGLRPSILNIRATQCAGGEAVGTSFVVKAGYVATAAHLVADSQACNGRIRLIDYRGLEHRAQLEGLSTAGDMAVLRFDDSALPPLQLADSATYETNVDEVIKLVTIGYPLEQAAASAQDSAAVSGEGSLSRFDRPTNVFITSGLNLNPGNSGGPVFLRKNWQVLGIASAKIRQNIGEGIGYVVSINLFKNFFREKTGQVLP